MRIKKNFAERTKVLESSEVNKKFFLIFEGEETEKLYFEGIEENRLNLGINPLIEIKEIKRSFNEKGWSNPKKILDRLLEFIVESESEEFLLSSIINCTLDLLETDNVITSESLYSIKDIEVLLSEYFENEKNISDLNISFDIEEAVSEIVNCLNRYLDLTNVINSLPIYIKSQKIVFDTEIDKMCLIVDRDKESFVNHEHNQQYNYVVDQCARNNIDLYISNPCFEFWLLLHFNEVFDLNNAYLLENPKITRNKRYAESELVKLVPGYSKSDIKFHLFIDKIDNAISNQSHFCEDVNGLENSIGSNIGNLITKMRE